MWLLSMLGLKLIHVSKTGARSSYINQNPVYEMEEEEE